MTVIGLHVYNNAIVKRLQVLCSICNGNLVCSYTDYYGWNTYKHLSSYDI